MKAICNAVIAPGRKEPADASEIMMQLVFGDLFTVIEIKDNWTKIKMEQYSYECWIDTKHFTEITPEEFANLKLQNTRVGNLTAPLEKVNNGNIINLVKGCLLPNFDNGKVLINGDEYLFSGSTNVDYKNNKDFVTTALEYLNAPYLWGGNSPFGIDCSGLTQMSLIQHNVQIPRDAYQQAQVGTPIDSIDSAQEGDLAFFDNKKGRIIHVGFILEDNKILHASGRVKIDLIDEKGIYSEEFNRYTHQLRSIKRIEI